jgi:hypothetical protein
MKENLNNFIRLFSSHKRSRRNGTTPTAATAAVHIKTGRPEQIIRIKPRRPFRMLIKPAQTSADGTQRGNVG